MAFKIKHRKILSALSALVFAFGMSAAMAVSADEKDDKSEEKEIIPFTFEEDKVDNVAEPALSFDGSEWKNFIHSTRDYEKGGIKFTQDKDTAYQGVSLKVTADTEGASGYFSCSGMVTDADNNLLYPDAPASEDSMNLNVIGIELHAEDFGLSTFDECFFTFAYRLTAEDEKALQGSSVWVFSADEDNVRTSNPFKLTVNTTMDDNVSRYRANAMLSVPKESNSTKLIFDIPTEGAIHGDVLFLDNIMIHLPDSAGEDLYVKNVDNFNANANIEEAQDEIKIVKKNDNASVLDKEEKPHKDGSKALTVVLVVVVVIGAGVGGFFAYKKLHNRFY